MIHCASFVYFLSLAMSTTNNEKYKAPALEKGLDILEYLAAKPNAQSQAEIATGLEKSPNEIYRMLASLEARGYIHRDSLSSKYSLTLKLYYLSHRHSLVEKLRSAAVQEMKGMSELVRQPCHLSVIHDSQVLVIAYSKSPLPIAVMIEEGNLYSLSNTASGKVLLSHADEESRATALKNDPDYKQMSKKKKQEYELELATIKSQGYCEMPSSYAQGIINFSVPIGNENSGVLASLTVSKLLTLKPEDSTTNEQILDAMRNCKRAIETNLGLA